MCKTKPGLDNSSISQVKILFLEKAQTEPQTEN